MASNRRPKINYNECLIWLLQNDDNHWVFGLTEKGTKGDLAPTLTAELACQCFGRSHEELAADLRKGLSLKRK